MFEARISKCIYDAEAGYEGMRFRDALKSSFFEMLLARDAYRDMCGKLELPLHQPLVLRFCNALYIMLAPICPHLCEHVWSSLLRNEGPVVAAPWPLATPPDASLLRADAYLAGKLHEFRLALLKASTGKPGKASAAPKAPRATAAVIVVAGGAPDWQVKPLLLLRGLWKGGDVGFGAEDPLAAVKALAQTDEALKPFFKRIMPLASNAVMDQKAVVGGALCPALAMESPFDEYAVWADNVNYVKRALDLPDGVVVLRTGDPEHAAALAVLVAAGGAAAAAGKGGLEAVVPLTPGFFPGSG